MGLHQHASARGIAATTHRRHASTRRAPPLRVCRSRLMPPPLPLTSPTRDCSPYRLGDSAYRTSSEFRLGIRRLGLHYSLAVDPQTTVFGMIGNRRGEPRGKDSRAVSWLAPK